MGGRQPIHKGATLYKVGEGGGGGGRGGPMQSRMFSCCRDLSFMPSVHNINSCKVEIYTQ